MDIFSNNKRLTETVYNKEADFEADVVTNHALLFGPKGIYIDAKKKVATKALGGTIPDGFYLDFSDPDGAAFYLVEVELATHGFYSHIFPQITKFFAFYKNEKSLKALIETLYKLIDNDADLRKRVKKFIGNKEIFKFLTDLLSDSQNILLVIDGDKPEFPEIMNTYTDTWGSYVKHIQVRRFEGKGETVFMVEPSFSDIDYVTTEAIDETDDANVPNEDAHLDKASDQVAEVYKLFKSKLLSRFPGLCFNPQKYYVSIKADKNIAFVKFSKSRLNVVIMRPEADLRADLPHHKIHPLSTSVQKFYNGPCARVVLAECSDLDELVEAFAPLADLERHE